MTKIKAITTQFVVRDVIRTAEYYRDFLGFEIIGYFLDPPVYAMVRRDGIEIHFGEADSDKVQYSSVELRKVGFDLYLWVDDIDSLFNELKEKSVNIIENITKRIYGNREFSIMDCNGFKIVFGE